MADKSQLLAAALAALQAYLTEAGPDAAAEAPKIPTIGARQVLVAPVVPDGTPDTWTSPVTKHVLSLGRPPGGDIETFVPYCVRVAAQCGYDPMQASNEQGAIMLAASDLGATDDEETWPLAADRYFNRSAYMTEEEKAKRAGAEASLAAMYKNMQDHANAHPEQTAAQQQLIAQHRAERAARRAARQKNAGGNTGTEVPIT